jgi:hypothetical protein
LKAVKTLVNNVSDRVTALGDGNDANAPLSYHDDCDYYLDMNTEPPRFAQYRLARNRNRIALE